MLNGYMKSLFKQQYTNLGIRIVLPIMFKIVEKAHPEGNLQMYYMVRHWLLLRV